MQKKLLKTAVLSGVLFVLPSIANADDSGSQKSAQPDSRAMLGSTLDGGSSEKQMTAEDFKWSAIAKNSPANGKDPIVGAGSGKAYYDFKDGNPHPFYIVPGK